MTTFDERERAFENKFQHDQDLLFRIRARRDKLAGLWAADLIGLKGAEADAYARQILDADFGTAGPHDIRNRLIADEVQQRGTVDHTPVYPREVVKRALELGASALILVHNHPSGDPTPSRADIDMTKEIGRAAQAVGVVLHDHIIVGKGKHSSFKGMGLL